MHAHPNSVFLRVVGMFVLEKEGERQMERSAKGAETSSKSELEKLNNELSFDGAGENPF